MYFSFSDGKIRKLECRENSKVKRATNFQKMFKKYTTIRNYRKYIREYEAETSWQTWTSRLVHSNMGKVWPGDYTSSFSSWFFIFKGIFQYEAFAYFAPPPQNPFKGNDRKPISLSSGKQKKKFFFRKTIIFFLFSRIDRTSCRKKCTIILYTFFIAGGLGWVVAPLFWQSPVSVLFFLCAPMLVWIGLSRGSRVCLVGECPGTSQGLSYLCLVNRQ